MAAPPISYCGTAPLMSELWGRWNFDPLLLAALLALGAYGFFGARFDRTGRLAFWGGYAALLIAFVSPLCALTSGLFAARSAHHLLLVAVAGPLLGYALPIRRRLPLSLVALIHICIFWLWHVPAAYQWALSNDLIYWSMQLSLLGSGIVFWNMVFRARSIAGEASTILAVIVQMGLLGALITFAPDPLYAPHLPTASLYGLTPLEDQQLAGLIMWVVSLPLYMIAAVPVLARRGASFRRVVA